MTMTASPLHQQDEPLSMEDRRNDEPSRVSSMMKGMEGQLFEDFYCRSSSLMDLPTLPMSTSSNLFREKRRLRKLNNNSTKEDSRISFIDGILDVIDYDYRLDCDEEEESSDEEGMIVPIKVDNYVNKRSRVSRSNKRRKELLLDNGSAITEALRALEEKASDDEVSLDEDDIEDG
jgi:hypothetical protein